jgi:hypothetical protein
MAALPRSSRGQDSEAKLWEEEVAWVKDNKKKMIIAFFKNTFLTPADLSKDSRLNHNHISPSAIQRMLSEEGLKARTPKSCLQISDKNLKLRKKFAEYHSSWIHRR